MDIDALFSQARELARQGDRPGARRILEDILQEQPTNEDVMLWHALVAPTKGDVIEGLQKVLEINPDNAQAQQRLARLRARNAGFSAFFAIAVAIAAIILAACRGIVEMPFLACPAAGKHQTD